MVFKIIYTPSFHNDTDEAIDWYETRKTGLGKLFLDRMGDAISLIHKNPYQFQKIYKNILRANLSVFPFSIYYEIHGIDVVLLAIVHQKRNPKSWKKRKL